jgi:hypothetical protein
MATATPRPMAASRPALLKPALLEPLIIIVLRLDSSSFQQSRLM